MADVIASMKPLPDADIEAMAEYLSTFWPAADATAEATAAIAAADAASLVARERYPGGARIFETACASCHANPQDLRLPSLALSTAVHADRPNNVILAVLGGSGHAASELDGPSLATMPAFRGLLDKGQLADLAAYVRARFAPGRTDWQEIGDTIEEVSAGP
jgi:nicotinate dehydrogenase subunit B